MSITHFYFALNEFTMLRVTAPAKLNLRLQLTGRRDDGYHSLEMWNVLTTLQDTLEIEITRLPPNQPSHVTFQVPSNPILNSSNNIAYRAAIQFLKAFSVSAHVDITLYKNIPVGAGLGGGSSNAAAVLKTLATEFAIEDLTSLNQLALSLGADVPYFLNGRASLVQGIGEKVTPLDLPFLHNHPCIIVMPTTSLATAKMYEEVRRHYPELPFTPSGSPPSHTTAIPNNYNDFIQRLVNDFEPIAIKINNEVKSILSILRSNDDLSAHMTGSGSALFVLAKYHKESIDNLETKVEKLLEGNKMMAKCWRIMLTI
jgi:4-diphosphocytidyl-2-C-methyl-D-erythritol kinase